MVILGDTLGYVGIREIRGDTLYLTTGMRKNDETNAINGKQFDHKLPDLEASPPSPHPARDGSGNQGTIIPSSHPRSGLLEADGGSWMQLDEAQGSWSSWRQLYCWRLLEPRGSREPLEAADDCKERIDFAGGTSRHCR